MTTPVAVRLAAGVERHGAHLANGEWRRPIRRNGRASRSAETPTSGKMDPKGADMPTLHARTVRRAAEIVGAIEALAVQLNVRDELISKCMEGE